MRKLSGQVRPGGIGLLDEPDFFLAAPAFDFFLAGDGGLDVGEFFKVDQAENSIACGESWSESLAMLDHALFEAAGHAGVQIAGTVGEDVDAVGSGHLIHE